jgi:glutathione S-transferase
VAAKLFHIALADDWAEAEATGEYRMSTRGAMLAEVGFVHLAYEHQVEGVVSRYYADVGELVVLELDPARLGAEIRAEAVDPGAEAFPHLYGPLLLDAVVAARLLRPGP